MNAALPEPIFDHLLRLTDGRGTFEHACFAEPHDAQDEATEDAVTVMARAITASPDPVSS